MTGDANLRRPEARAPSMSTGRSIERALRELEEAGRELAERSRGITLGHLCDVLDRWRDPGSRVRQALEAELPRASGFDAAMVRDGLALALDPWSGEALRACVEREVQRHDSSNRRRGATVGGFPVTSVSLAGSIPMPSLLASIAPLTLGSAAAIKPASRDRSTPRLVAESIAEADALLGRCVAVLPFSSDDEVAARAFFGTDCVTATGSDESLAEISRFVSARQRWVPYGHRISLAVIGADALGSSDALDECARELAIDTALWDQLGCLSPVAVYVVGDESSHAGDLASALAEALSSLQQRWPRAAISSETAAAISRERSEAEMRAAVGRTTRVFASSDTSWTVVLEADAAIRPAPLHRFVRVLPVPSIDELERALRPLSRILAGVALAGFGDREEDVAQRLCSLGASRICAPGRLQAPPLDWPRDNRPLLLPLARLAQHERDSCEAIRS